MPPRRLLGLVLVALVAGCFSRDESHFDTNTDGATSTEGTAASTQSGASTSVEGTTASEPTSTSDACPPGTADCPCDGGQCDADLSCVGGTCVDPTTSTTGTTGMAGADSTGSTTSDGTTGAMSCGDGMVEPPEECDGGAGCLDCELTDFECNPLVQTGCPRGSQCIWDVFDNNFTCAAAGDVAYGAECTSMQNLYCEPGLICVNADNFPNCLAGACCSSYCNTANGNADCFAPLQCVSFWQVGYDKMGKEGLDDIGICLDL